MKFYAYFVLLGLSLILSPAHSIEIHFAPLPMEKSKIVIGQIKPMLNYLEKRTPHRFKIVFLKNYDEIIQHFQAGDIDLAFLGPLPYVILAYKNQNVIPLVRFLSHTGKDTYTCSLFHIMDEDIAPFTGKRLGLTQPYSTCGYLSMLYLVKNLGGHIKQMRYRYVGSHSEVALSLARGEFELGGIKTSIGQKFVHLGLEPIAKTEPLPGFVLAANSKTLSNDVIQNIAETLLKLKPLDHQADAITTVNWGENVRYGSVPAKDSDFDGIREKLRGLVLPLEGNF